MYRKLPLRERFRSPNKSACTHIGGQAAAPQVCQAANLHDVVQF